MQFRPEELKSSDNHPTPRRIEALLALQQVLQSNLLILNILLLLLLATTSFQLFQILGLAFMSLVVVHLLAGASRLKKRSKRIALRHLESLLAVANALQPALNLLDNTRFIITTKRKQFTSKTELLDALAHTEGVFTKAEKRQIRAILEPRVAATPRQNPQKLSAVPEAE